MGYLHDEFAKFKTAISNATHFADAEAYVKDKEAEFKETLVNAIHELEQRVDALFKHAVAVDTRVTAVELHPALSIPELPPVGATAATLVPVGEPLADGTLQTAESLAWAKSTV